MGQEESSNEELKGSPFSGECLSPDSLRSERSRCVALSVLSESRDQPSPPPSTMASLYYNTGAKMLLVC